MSESIGRMAGRVFVRKHSAQDLVCQKCTKWALFKDVDLTVSCVVVTTCFSPIQTVF